MNKTYKKLNIKRYLIYTVIFAIISFFTLYYIYKIYENPASLFIFTTFSRKWIISLLILLGLYYLLDGLRLHYILKVLNIKVRFGYIFKLVFINIFISSVTPFASGGGIAQVYFLNKKGVSPGKATAATTIRTFMPLSFVFIGTPLIFLGKEKIAARFTGIPVFSYLFIFIFLYSALFYIIIFKNRIIKSMVYRFLRFIYNKNLISHNKYYNSVKFLLKNIDLFGENLALFVRGNLLQIFLSIFFTLLFLLAEFTFSILILKGMGYQVDYLTVIFMQVIIIFLMYFAPTPGASGVAEGGYSLLFSRLVSQNEIFPLIFAWRFFTKYIGIGIGIILFIILLLQGDNDYEKQT
ncbi:MAG: lysylphosphatidylglycerol synthase transmembrane domain-containing protein [Bacillota bacterium]